MPIPFVPTKNGTTGSPAAPTTAALTLPGQMAVNAYTGTAYMRKEDNTISDIVGDRLSGFRNRIINGGMQIWQRATSFTSSGGSNVYCCDRWGFRSNGSAVTVAQNTSNPASTGAIFPFSIKYQRNSGQTSVNGNYIFQVVESFNCYDLSGQSVTLSFWAKAGANFSSSGNSLTCVVQTGTVADEGSSAFISTSWTGVANVINTTVTLSTTWTKYTLTGTVGSGIQELGIYFAYSGTGTAGADDSFYITGVQLEKGLVATPFEVRSYGTELALCQRYYWKSDLGTAAILVGSGNASVTNQTHWINVKFPTTMRASASVSIIGTWANVNTTTVNPGVDAGNTNFVRLSIQSTSTGVFYTYDQPAGSGLQAIAEL